MKLYENLDLSEALDGSIELSDWTAEKIDGLKIPELPNRKRLQLSMACQHLAFGHAQAIVVLIEKELIGSALALIRPMFEAIIRGVWLRYSASEEDIENFSKDKFPSTSEMTKNSPKSESSPLYSLKERWWETLCGYTHGGEEQIYARLGVTGLKEDFENGQIILALRWSDMVHLYAGIELADAAEDGALAGIFLNRMIAYEDGKNFCRKRS